MEACPHGSGNWFNWRDGPCNNGASSGCDHSGPVGRVFDATVAFFGLSAIATMVFTIQFYCRCCGSMNRGKHRMHGTVGMIGLVCLLLGVVIFAAGLPKAARDNLPDGTPCMNGPCKSFIGTDTDATTGLVFVWMPAGWIAGAASLFLYIFLICCACSPSADKEQSTFGGAYIPMLG